MSFQDPSATEVSVDAGGYGPPVKEAHYYYDQRRIGLAVSLYPSRTGSLSAIPEELVSIIHVDRVTETREK